MVRKLKEHLQLDHIRINMGKKKKGTGGSPGQHTPDWDKDWPPKPVPQPPTKLAKRNFRPTPHDQSVNA